MLENLRARTIYRLPRRARWKLARMTGGQPKRWVQWIYDSDKEYSLRGMRERNCIFIHIPKCAGISLASSLLGNYGGAHATADDYMSVFGAEWFDRAFKFTFVRDPWSRTVSAFDFLRRGGFHADDAAFGEKHLSHYAGIADFVADGLEREEVRSWVHFRDQVDFLIDPRTNGLCADYLGRVETIEKDFRTICDRLKINADLKVKNSREKASGDQSLKLDAKTIDRIARIYARDVEMLGYGDYPLP